MGRINIKSNSNNKKIGEIFEVFDDIAIGFRTNTLELIWERETFEFFYIGYENYSILFSYKLSYNLNKNHVIIYIPNPQYSLSSSEGKLNFFPFDEIHLLYYDNFLESLLWEKI